MIKNNNIVIFALALLLVACGAAPAAVVPTTVPDPTLTNAARQGVQTIRTRAASMTQAAQDLAALGQEIRATVAWKAQVRTAAQVITGGQQTIAQVQLPASYAPLAQRTKAITANCAKPAESLLAAAPDTLTTTMVRAQQDALQRWCVTELARLRASLDTVQ